MGDKTNIAWCDSSWNPLRGCSRVSDGCQNCYAEKVAWRFNGPGLAYEGLTTSGSKGPRWNGKIKLLPKLLDQPLRWKKPRRIFVNSTSDLFHENVPDGFIDRVFAVMALASWHTFQVLTKRPERMREYLTEAKQDTQAEIWRTMSEEHGWMSREDALSIACPPGTIYPTDPEWPLPNVHLYVSVEDQPSLDERVPHLLATPAAVRGISAEPLLAGIELFDTSEGVLRGVAVVQDGYVNRAPSEPDDPIDASFSGIDHLIVGGESGPGARPCDVEWIRSIVKQCKAAGTLVFVKQLGAKPCDLSAGAWRTQPNGIQNLYFGERSSATIWPNGTWSTWDAGGVGGENDTGPFDCARRDAEAALVRQMWHGIKLKHPKGGDITEFPEDLRVQQLPGEAKP